MVAERDPLVGPLAAANARLYDVVGLHVGLHVDLEVQAGLAAEPILDRERPLPLLRRGRPAQAFENRLRIAPRERHAHDGGHRYRFRRRDAVRAWRGGPPWCQWITGNDVVVGDAAPLEVALGSPRTLREHLALGEPVLHRIRVDDDGGRALTLGRQRLEPPIAVRVRVADDDDLALGIDTGRAKPVVVLGVAAVGVDDRRRHLARGREREPRPADVLVRRVRILAIRVLLQGRHVAPRRHHLDADFARVGRQHVVAADDDVLQALLLPGLRDPLGDGLGPGRGRGMRLRGEIAVPVGDPPR